MYEALRSFAFLAALLVLFRRFQRHWPVLLLALPALLVPWLAGLVPGLDADSIDVVFHATAALFLGLTAWVLLDDIFRAESVSQKSIYAAMAAYLLVGVVAGMWTEQGEYHDDDGTSLRGRAAIEEAFRDFFKEKQGSKVENHVNSE